MAYGREKVYMDVDKSKASRETCNDFSLHVILRFFVLMEVGEMIRNRRYPEFESRTCHKDILEIAVVRNFLFSEIRPPTYYTPLP